MSKKVIYLASGCYWGAEKYFQDVKGVLKTEVGFANGNDSALKDYKGEKPFYYEVKKDVTGFAETTFIEYDDNVVSLRELLGHHFNIIDPTSLNKQGEDEGSQYRTGIYYTDESERKIIDDFIKEQQKNFKSPIVVEVEKLKNYYPAHPEHQKYLDKNPDGYCHIGKTKIAEAKVKSFK